MKVEAIEIKRFSVKRLKDRMVRRGINQAGLAKLMGISANGVSYWMKEKQIPHVKRMAKLAKVLGVKVDYFFQEGGVDEN